MYKLPIPQEVTIHHEFARKSTFLRKILYTGLFGSQNTNLATEKSDVDTKTIALPSLRDLIVGTPNFNNVYTDVCFGHIEISDLGTTFERFLKQDPATLEILFTDYYVMEAPFREEIMMLRENRELIAHYNKYAAVSAISKIGINAYDEVVKSKTKLQGYHQKKFSILLRMEQFLEKFVKGAPYAECLDASLYPNYQDILAAKRYDFSEKTVEEMAIRSLVRVEELRKTHLEYNKPVNKEVPKLLEEISISIMKKSLREDLFEGE